MARWRKIVRRGGLAFAGLLGLLLLAFAFAQTGPGRAMVERGLESALAGPGQAVEIEGLGGRLPDRIRLQRITVADAAGAWLTARDVALDWRPLRLLAGRLHVERLRAERLSLARLPAGEPMAPAAPAAEPAPALPQLPFALRVDSLAVEAIDLGAAVLGTPAALRLTGTLSSDTGAAIESALAVERIDGPLGALSLTATYHLARRTLDIDAQLREAPDGLIAHLLGVDGLPAIDLSLAGRGPIADWRGRLVGRSGQAARVEAALSIAAGETVEFGVDGRAEVAGLVPSAYRQFVAPAVTFAVDGAWEPAAAVARIVDASLASAAGTVALSGRLDAEAGEVDATLRAELDGAPLSPLIDPAALAALAVELELSGPLAAPETRFSVNASEVTLATVSAAELAAVGSVTVAPRRGAREPVFEIAATVEADGFAAGDPALAGLLGTRPRGFVAGALDPAQGVFEASDVRLRGDAIALSARGTAALDGAGAKLTLAATLDSLQRATRGLGVSLAGSATADADVRIEADTVSVALRGTVTDFSSGIAELDGLLGGRLDVTANATGGPDGAWRIADISLDAANAALDGDLDIAGDFSAIESRYAARVRDLSPLGPSLGVALAGRAESTGTVTGSLDRLTLAGTLDGADLAIDGVRVPRASLALEARDLTGEPSGSFALDVAGPLAASGRGTFRVAADAWHFSAIEAEAPGLRATGDLAVPTGDGALSGTVRAEAGDLAPLADVLGLPLSGRATAAVSFGAAQGEPSLEATLEARDLVFDVAGEALRAATVAAEARVAYTRADMGFSVSLDASGLRAPAGTLERVAAAAQGSLQDMRFDVRLRGDIAGKTELASAGALSQDAGGTTLVLSSLAGELAGREIALASPARLRLADDGGVALDLLELGFAGGQVTAQGELGANAVSGDLALRDMPLAALAIGAGDLPIDGAIDSKLRVAGSPTQPQASLTVEGRGLQLRPLPQGEPATIDMSLSASLGDGRLTFETTAAGGDAFSLTARGEAPARFSARPFVLVAPADGAVQGTVAMAGDIAVVERLAPLDPHRLRGTVRADATVAGTVAAPVVSGQATLADGAYENVEIGTVLDGVEATVELSEGRANIRATALDSASGRLDLNGHVDLARPRTVDLALNMAEATVVRRDEVTATASGELFAKGDLADLLFSGRIETEAIEVRLVESLPPDIVRLDVTEVGQARTPAEPPPEESAPAFEARLDIDVNIPNRLFVRGRGLDSEWQGNLRVVGTTQDPKVTGKLSAVRGQFSFAGKTFELDRGTIAIDERAGELVALLDVATVFTGDDFVARINVTGPASQPQIALDSTPELPRDEILARILFGRGTGQLSPVEALQLAEAAASLSGAGGGSTGVLDQVRTALGVDVLRVSGGEGDAGPTVQAGKYVADGVFVGAKQGAGPDTSAATVEIELTPNISVESEVGHSGRSEVGVNWKFNY